MNRNDFLEILEQKVPGNNAMLGELSELITIFPYFQSAHLLLLKGLSRNEDVRFSSQLRNSSVFIADREVLYNFLKEPVGEVAAASVTVPEVTDEPQPEPQHVVVSQSVELPEIQIVYAPERQEDTEDIETEQTVIESAKNSDEIISVIEKDSEVSQEESVAQVKQYDEESGIIVMTDDEEAEDEVHTFAPQNDKEDKEEDVELLELLELDADNSDYTYNILATSDNIPSESEQPDNENQTTVLSQADLIDRFIISNPRIEPIRDKKEIPVEDRSVPVYDESGFVTETLARIYVSQGYYSRAIDIFEKLTLKFPEKSSYFAAQIEKVKEYLKK